MTDVLAVLEHTSSAAADRSAFPLPPAAVERHSPLGRSRFETLARLSADPSPHRARMLDVLLAAICAGVGSRPPLLAPIWAEEAMHRSCTVIRLLAARSPRGNAQAESPLDHDLAQDLAAAFRSLDEAPPAESALCSDVLRNVAAGLAALFADRPGTGSIILSTRTEQLRLPACKCRALVLAAAELVMNALLHAFPKPCSGRIEVTLDRLGPARARLRVMDNGTGFVAGRPNLHCGVAAGLAELLEADLVYSRTNAQTVAEIDFPIGAGCRE